MPTIAYVWYVCTLSLAVILGKLLAPYAPYGLHFAQHSIFSNDIFNIRTKRQLSIRCLRASAQKNNHEPLKNLDNTLHATMTFGYGYAIIILNYRDTNFLR